MGFLQKLRSSEKNSLENKEVEVSDVAEEVIKKLKSLPKKEYTQISASLKEQRKPIEEKTKRIKKKIVKKQEYIKTGIPGMDSLMGKGIPQGTSVLVAGGAGSGKTVMCLQILYNAAKRGEKGLYISLEETEFRLKEHMRNFGWNPEELEKKGLIKVTKIKPFGIARKVEALLTKAKGQLKIPMHELGEIITTKFQPKWIIIDSLTALAYAFKDEETGYRLYIEQLFEYLEQSGATSFLISETEQIPTKFSRTGVEEFLADGVIVLYNIKHGDIKENAIEILKIRGVKHEKKIVPMQISPKGIVVYPKQKIFPKF